MRTFTSLLAAFVVPCTLLRAAGPPPLLHPAFDHLGSVGEQSATAAAAGANVLFCTGIGSLAYSGLPPRAELDKALAAAGEYAKGARSRGVRTNLGYLCATSIVHLDTFDRNWPAELRGGLSSPPQDWLQQNADGHALGSWYGPPYAPACMNNPDWRTYQKYVLRLTLGAGYDGIFFDNPTVHPDGCYCPHCMRKFAAFLAHPATAAAADAGSVSADAPSSSQPSIPSGITALRAYARSHPRDFLRFRATIAADFLAEMRTCARAINPRAVVTCNNSLNAPETFYSQVRTYGYNIGALSRVEDYVVIEDMATQPRALANGSTVEYAPVYELLRAISHNKPVLAVTLADADYHTPPNLARLAMCEAAVHGAAYLAWPTWPEAQRGRMSAALRRQSDFLDRHAGLLTHTTPVIDAAVYLPRQRWLDTDTCAALATARTLSANNIQYTVLSEDDLIPTLGKNPPPALFLESESLLAPAGRAALGTYRATRPVLRSATPDDLKSLHPMITIDPPDPYVRATLRRQGDRQILHLLNLNTTKLSSFEDRTTPAKDVRLHLRLPRPPKAVTAHTPDATAAVPFTAAPGSVDVTVREIDVHTVLTFDF